MPTELELIALETEFDLYLSFTKRLVLNLPDPGDRTRAAIWLQKLRSVNSDDHMKLRNEHLKLLLFALHRRSLLSVFAKPPPEELESFHDGHTLMEMTRELIEMTEQKLGSGDNNNECPLPPVFTNVSADLKEYCASQSIPKFGAHVYYAISNEPIQMWRKSANCVYPDQHDVPNPLQWELTLSKLTDNVLEKQAEAEHLAAEAAKDDKTEEKDDTQVLPKIDVPVCPGQLPFKWKPDSILNLHQNYNFSDVGVAEDLEEQGKFQLELDEMAFGILDHSLPGRQRVVIRDPYYDGLPSDLAERRLHGVIDEVEEESTSSSSSEMDSINEVYGNQGITAISKMPISNLFNDKYKNAGPIARKYLSANHRFLFGVHFEQEKGEFRVGQSPVIFDGDDIVANFDAEVMKIRGTEGVGEFRVGHSPVIFDGDDIVANFDGEVMKIRGTEGVWRLLTQDTTYLDEDDYYTDADWVIYMEVLMRTNNKLFGNDKVEISQFSHGGRSETSQKEGIKKLEKGEENEISSFYFGLGQLKDKVAENLGNIGMPNLGLSMPPIPSLGFGWPELTLGIPNLGLSMPSVPGLDYLKYWKWFENEESIYLKSLDYLIRRLINLENLRLASKVVCIATQTCLLFWILELIVALMGKHDGVNKFIDWVLINEPLVKACDLLNNLVKNLPFGLNQVEKPVCDLRSNMDEKECKLVEERYKEYLEQDAKFVADVQQGIDVLQKIFSNDSSFFERIDGLHTVSKAGFNFALQSGLNFLKSYFNSNLDITATSTKTTSNKLYVGNYKNSGLNDKTSSCPQLKIKFKVSNSELNDKNFSCPQLRKIVKNKPPAHCKCCGKKKNANLNLTAMSAVNQTSTLKNVGPIARKYLSPKDNFRFGIHFVKETGEYQVGSLPLIINGDDIAIQFEGEVVMYRGTEGVWRLLTQDMSNFNDDFSFSDEDWAVYMEILMRSNKEVMMMGKETFVDEFSGRTLGDRKSYEDEEDAIKIDNLWGFGKIGKALGVSLPKLGVSVPDPKSVMQGLFGKISNYVPDLRLGTDCVYMKKLDELIRIFAKVQTQEKTELVIATRVDIAVSIIECIFAIIGSANGWFKFIKWALFNEQVLATSNFLHYITDELEFELHLPGSQFCGPGTKVIERIAKGHVGSHPTDAACKEHDLFYVLNKDKDARLKSDMKLGVAAFERLLSSDASLLERSTSFFVIEGMALKIMLEYAMKFVKTYFKLTEKLIGK